LNLDRCGPAALRLHGTPGPEFTRLDVAFNELHDANAQELATLPLTHLFARGNRLTGLPLCPHLLELDLALNPLGGRQDGKPLSTRLRLSPRCTHVNLANTNLHDDDLTAVVCEGGLLGVESLNLAWNPVSESSLLGLPQNCPRLKTVELTGTRLTRASIRTLASLADVVRVVVQPGTIPPQVLRHLCGRFGTTTPEIPARNDAWL
jgi:hypothetical protein